jgi:hypothetical protein
MENKPPPSCIPVPWLLIHKHARVRERKKKKVRKGIQAASEPTPVI